MVSWKIRRKKPGDRIVKKTPKDSVPSVIREKTPDQGSPPPIKQKTPISSSKAERFKIPPPRLSTTGNVLKEVPFIPSREGYTTKKQRKEQFVSIPPPIIQEETYPDNRKPPPKKSPSKIKEQPHTSSNTTQVHDKKPEKTSNRSFPTPFGATKTKPRNSTNIPLSVLDKSKSISKSAIRPPPTIKKAKNDVNHRPPQKIKIKTPVKTKKPTLSNMNATTQKKVANRPPPHSIKSKTPSQNEQTRPPPTYLGKIPKTRIKRKTPR